MEIKICWGRAPIHPNPASQMPTPVMDVWNSVKAFQVLQPASQLYLGPGSDAYPQVALYVNDQLECMELCLENDEGPFQSL